jgi:hypothetical protein
MDIPLQQLSNASTHTTVTTHTNVGRTQTHAHVNPAEQANNEPTSKPTTVPPSAMVNPLWASEDAMFFTLMQQFDRFGPTREPTLGHFRTREDLERRLQLAAVAEYNNMYAHTNMLTSTKVHAHTHADTHTGALTDELEDDKELLYPYPSNIWTVYRLLCWCATNTDLFETEHTRAHTRQLQLQQQHQQQTHTQSLTQHLRAHMLATSAPSTHAHTQQRQSLLGASMSITTTITHRHTWHVRNDCVKCGSSIQQTSSNSNCTQTSRKCSSDHTQRLHSHRHTRTPSPTHAHTPSHNTWTICPPDLYRHLCCASVTWMCVCRRYLSVPHPNTDSTETHTHRATYTRTHSCITRTHIPL